MTSKYQTKIKIVFFQAATMTNTVYARVYVHLVFTTFYFTDKSLQQGPPAGITEKSPRQAQLLKTIKESRCHIKLLAIRL
jgi:hypothetical protein